MCESLRTSSKGQLYSLEALICALLWLSYREDAPESAGDSTLEQVEREHIIRVLRDTGGVVSKAATRLGMPRTTLNALMRKLGISRQNL